MAEGGAVAEGGRVIVITGAMAAGRSTVAETVDDILTNLEQARV